MSLKTRTEERLQELHSSPKFSLGQNFLINESVVQKIIKAVQDFKCEDLVEIGPGVGSLTDSLIDLNFRMTLLELDSLFANYWRSRNQEVHEGDALQTNWDFTRKFNKWVLVSNLPYQISSSLVIDRSMNYSPKGMILMFQKEVADRIMAKPKTKDYGILSVIAQSQWQISSVVRVGASSFWPKPKIESQVLRFVHSPKISQEQMPQLLSLVKLLFSERRKQIGNLIQRNPKFSLPQTIAKTCRAEELSLNQFFEILQGSL